MLKCVIYCIDPGHHGQFMECNYRLGARNGNSEALSSHPTLQKHFFFLAHPPSMLLLPLCVWSGHLCIFTHGGW